ncbi:unnamed protein product [Prorocentrum cordatum]|uniref:Ion transport domain-containing protein n=1 Tax=Prorocentrum cordatum TaxID=2364126 RepID=A0ABN9VFS3_9DINO|nr:unnamed protein product [Polarella glacialis]
MPVSKARQLTDRLEDDARDLFHRIPASHFDLLGLPRDSAAAAREPEMLRLLSEDGSRPSPQQMQAVHDVFLSIVEAKYWLHIHTGEFSGEEAEHLLSSVASARPLAAWRLRDLEYLRRYLLDLHTFDAEATSATTMQSAESMRSSGEAWERAVSSSTDGPSVSALAGADSQTAAGVNSLVPEGTEHKGRLRRLVDSYAYTVASMFVVMCWGFVSMGIAISTDRGDMEKFGQWSVVIVCMFGVLMLDLGLRLLALGRAFFKNGWNVLDAVCTLVAVLGFVLELLVAEHVRVIIWGTPVSQEVDPRRGLLPGPAGAPALPDPCAAGPSGSPFWLRSA